MDGVYAHIVVNSRWSNAVWVRAVISFFLVKRKHCTLFIPFLLKSTSLHKRLCKGLFIGGLWEQMQNDMQIYCENIAMERIQRQKKTNAPLHLQRCEESFSKLISVRLNVNHPKKTRTSSVCLSSGKRLPLKNKRYIASGEVDIRLI